MPGVRPKTVMSQVVDRDAPKMPPGDEVVVKYVAAGSPSAPAVHVRCIVPSAVTVAVTPVGASGARKGVVEAEGVDGTRRRCYWSP